MAKTDTFSNIAFGVSALLDPISQILGWGSFDNLTSEMQNKIEQLATKAYNELTDKAARSSTSSIGAMATNMPNRDEIERALYNDLANDTYKLMKEVEEAKIKDKASGRQNGVLKIFADTANSVANAFTNVGALMGIPGASNAHNITINKYSDWANENLKKVQNKVNDINNLHSQKVADFNKKLAASHNATKANMFRQERVNKNEKKI